MECMCPLCIQSKQQLTFMSAVAGVMTVRCIRMCLAVQLIDDMPVAVHQTVL